MASIFDKKDEKPSMVADIMSGGKQMLRGAASNITGAIDFISIAPQTLYRSTVKGDNFSKALRDSNQGLLTTATGLNAPAANSPEAYLYKAGQILMPTKAPTSAFKYGGEVAANALLDTGFQALEGNEAATGLLGGGLLAGAFAGKKLRDLALRNRGITPEVAARAQAAGRTVGQETGNANALRAEESLATSRRADDVRSFYTNQADSFGRLVERTSKVDMRMPDADVAIAKTFETIKNTFKARQKSLSDQFGKDLEKFYSKTGGGNRKFIPSDPMVAQIDELIEANKASVGSTGNEAVIKELEKIRKQLTDETGNPRKISGKEFKEQQSYWSQASASSGSWLDGIASDRAKAMASKMANAMDETFDAAVDNPAVALKSPTAVKALEEFKTARQNYRTAKEDMEFWAAKPVNRYFDVENVSSLNGQDIIDKMANLSPESRRNAIEYLNYIKPELVDNIRAKMADDLVAKGMVSGAAEGAAKFDPQAFLTAVDEASKKDKLLLDVMFPNAKQQADFTRRIAEARKLVLSGTAPQKAGSSPIAKAAEDAASLAGGIKGRVGVRGVREAAQGAVNSLVIGEDALFRALFKGEDVRNKFTQMYTSRVGLKSAAQEQTREATRYEDEEVAKLYKQYLEEEAAKAQQAPAEPQPVPTPMEQAPTAPTGSTEAPMSDEEVMQLYLQYQQNEGIKR